MGSPCFYYYPVAGSLETVNLGALRLSDLIVGTVRDTIDGYSRTGTMYRDSGGSRQRVRIVVERFRDIALQRKLESMSAHLERGGSVGFCVDEDKLWGSFMTSASSATRGTVALNTSGNLWSAWSSGALGTLDEVCVNSAPPESTRDYHQILGSLTASSTVVSLDSGLTYTSTVGPILVRYRDFWPALKMPGGQVDRLSERPILTNFRRLGYTLDLTLEEDWGTLSAWANNDPTTGSAGDRSASYYGFGVDEVSTGYNAYNPHDLVSPYGQGYGGT